MKTHGRVFPPFCCKARLIGLIFGLLPAANTAHTHTQKGGYNVTHYHVYSGGLDEEEGGKYEKKFKKEIPPPV